MTAIPNDSNNSNDSNTYDRPIELDPLPLPELPKSVAALIVAIGAIVPIPYELAFEALSVLIGPVRQWPEGAHKSAVRAAKDAKLTEMNAARSATQRQAMPVTRPEPATQYPGPGTSTVAPRLATWNRIKTGQHAGQWGARIPSGRQYVRIGDIVRVEGSRGASLQRVLTIVTGDNTYTLAAVEEVRNAPEPRIATNTPAQGTPVVTVAVSAPEIARVMRRVDGQGDARLYELTAPWQGASYVIVSVLTEEQASTSMSNSERVAIFQSNANGDWCGNLASEPTGQSHEWAIRVLMGYAPRGELPIEIAAESAQEPVQPRATGPVVHEPTGPSIFDRPASERVFRVGETQSAPEVRKLLSERDLIAGAVAEGSMLQVSWVGGGSTTLGKVRDALIAINRETDAPSAPSAVAHAGRAVESLRNREFDTARLSTRDLPEGISARWLVGRKLTGAKAQAGDAYGEALLIVSLKDDDTLAFDGDVNLANAVRGHYATATAKEALKSEDLTAWLGRILKRRHGAVKRGPVWYVPGGQAEAARALSEAIGKLWGDHERIPVTTGADLIRSLTRGLIEEATAVAKDLTVARDQARERAAAKAKKEASELNGATEASIEAAVDLAKRRSEVSPTVASRLLRSLVSVAARVAGYETVLGADATSNAKALIADLRSQLEKVADDGSARAAMLELV